MATNRHTYIHMHVRNVVTLVWGLLRLAPIKNSLVVFLNYQHLPTHANNGMHSGDVVTLPLIHMTCSLVGVFMTPQG